MAYGGERAWAAERGPSGAVEVVVLEKEAELRRFLEAAGAEVGNASSKLVRGRGRGVPGEVIGNARELA